MEIIQADLPIRITEFCNKNLDQGSIMIFDQWKLFCLIDMIPGLLYEVKPGIQTIKKNNFYWSKIFVEPWWRFFRNSYQLDYCIHLGWKKQYLVWFQALFHFATLVSHPSSPSLAYTSSTDEQCYWQQLKCICQVSFKNAWRWGLLTLLLEGLGDFAKKHLLLLSYFVLKLWLLAEVCF